ncbi:hypothetical protein Ahy_A04g017133 [Arachis hypogaea]|uniref:Uncharacterized protein n=1 Tax=Arachis hypogaea TaxID=3818 RepID=A0A445DA59_ARAHY|nr:hypothetical protein Ahy_A04g017133 [Arachis hypogaea]
MDVERSSLCNCVVNFLLEENYLLTAFELLHELLEDGRDHHAIRLKQFFSDPSLFPPDQISRLNSLRGSVSVSFALWSSDFVVSSNSRAVLEKHCIQLDKGMSYATQKLQSNPDK